LTSRAELSSSFTPHVTAWRELRGPLPIDTPNDSGEYKVWLVPFGSATIGLDGITIAFDSSNRKTDNFKVKGKECEGAVGAVRGELQRAGDVLPGSVVADAGRDRHQIPAGRPSGRSAEAPRAPKPQ